MTDDEKSAEEIERLLDEAQMFTSVGDAYRELEGADDAELVRLILAFDADDDAIETDASLSSRAMATFMLRERGYVVDGEMGDVRIRDPDGERVAWNDVN